MKNKVIIIFAVLLSGLVFLSLKPDVVSASSTYPTKGVVVSDVSISGGGRTARYNQLDLYMTSSDARAYAAKMSNGSYSSAVAWFAAGFIPGIGPYVAGFGFALGLGTHQNVNTILAAANRYSKVHISVGNGMILSAGQWDGRATSVTPVKSTTTQKTSVGVTITTKVHVDKRVLKS